MHQGYILIPLPGATQIDQARQLSPTKGIWGYGFVLSEKYMPDKHLSLIPNTSIKFWAVAHICNPGTEEVETGWILELTAWTGELQIQWEVNTVSKNKVGNDWGRSQTLTFTACMPTSFPPHTHKIERKSKTEETTNFNIWGASGLWTAGRECGTGSGMKS